MSCSVPQYGGAVSVDVGVLSVIVAVVDVMSFEVVVTMGWQVFRKLRVSRISRLEYEEALHSYPVQQSSCQVHSACSVAQANDVVADGVSVVEVISVDVVVTMG